MSVNGRAKAAERQRENCGIDRKKLSPSEELGPENRQDSPFPQRRGNLGNFCKRCLEAACAVAFNSRPVPRLLGTGTQRQQKSSSDISPPAGLKAVVGVNRAQCRDGSGARVSLQSPTSSPLLHQDLTNHQSFQKHGPVHRHEHALPDFLAVRRRALSASRMKLSVRDLLGRASRLSPMWRISPSTSTNIS